MTFLTFLITEESAFAKVRKRPYRILGQFHPSKLDQDTIHNEMKTFLKNTNYRMYSGEVRDPRENKRTFDEADPKLDPHSGNAVRDYHMDSGGSAGLMALWANRNPTRLRTIKKKVASKYKYGEVGIVPGKRIGGDIKPNDVVIVANHKTAHAMPNKIANDRWFGRWDLKKSKKNLQEGKVKILGNFQIPIPTEENPLRKDFKKIYKLGNSNVKKGFRNFLTSKGLTPAHKNDALSHFNSPTFAEWHQDFTRDLERLPDKHDTVVHSTKNPTRLRDIKTKKLVKGLKAGDVVQFNDKEFEHAGPQRYTAGTVSPAYRNRWFSHAMVKKLKEEKIKVIGNFQIPIPTKKNPAIKYHATGNHMRQQVKIGFEKFLNSKGYSKNLAAAPEPALTSFDSSTNREWHQDFEGKYKGETAVHSTKNPTEFRDIKTKKRIGTKIKPGDVAIFNDSEVEHRGPIGQKNRWFSAMDVKKNTGLQEK